jgi:polyhydroxyalkanoate synthesis regulator phasin
MSSTLFGRGTNTQVGGRKRAEDQDRAVLSIRTALDELKVGTTTEVIQQKTRIAALEATVASLQKMVAATAATGTAFDELKVSTTTEVIQQKARIAALEATVASLQKMVSATVATIATLSASATTTSDAPPS